MGVKHNSAVSRGVDWLVGVMSGAVPVRGLEGSSAYRITVGLVVIGLGLSSWLVWRNITSLSFRPSAANVNSTTAIAELEKLRSKDTDADTLSDYDELFIIHTSPYLGDSDSDGTTDAQEVATRSDPNCPAGQSCATPTTITAGSDATVSAGFLRQALRASGVAQATLDGLSDEDIIRIYGNVSDQADANTNVAGPSLAELESLSPADIRALLKEAGVDDATLKDIDDATLKEIFKQALTSESR